MMEISPVSHIDSDIGKPASNWRTSTQARLPHGHDPIVNSINTRVAEVIKVSKSHQEPLQVLNYQKGQKYDTHHDFFDPSVYKNQPDMLAMVDQDGSRNRLATLLWYMSTPEAGGETAFPRAGGLARPPDFRCEGAAGQQGIKVPALKGRAVLFYSLRPDGAIDPFSLHGGCPPIGETPKWAVNQWVWSKAYH
jgi:prolyl 4-hydroxylase